MILYNVTVNIDDSVHDDWLKWMKEKHIPDVMDTGCFAESKIFRIMVEEQQGTSYSIQYFARTPQDLQRYLDEYAPALRQEHTTRYADKFTAFRTLLKQV